MTEKHSEPKLSNREKQKISKQIEDLHSFMQLPEHEQEQLLEAAEDKELRKPHWNNLDASTRVNSILTFFIIIIAGIALYFQWEANKTTQTNLDLIQKEFELAYRPFLSVEKSNYFVNDTSFSISFTLKNSGNVPAIYKIKSNYSGDSLIHTISPNFQQSVLFPNHNEIFLNEFQ